MNPLQIIQLVLHWGPTVKAIWDEANTNDQAITKIKQLSAPLASLLEGIGQEFFPSAAPALHIAGGIVAAFDPNVTKWIQGGLNAHYGPHLAVDGFYGPATRASVARLQTELGLTADGLAGQLTQAALAKLLG